MMICANFGYNWPSGSRKEVENVKVHKRTDGRRVIKRCNNIANETLNETTVTLWGIVTLGVFIVDR
jgi:hypothetical protein